MRRGKQAEGANEGAGMMRWLLTYSDMITLLMVFFIVLYAVSQVNNAKYQVLMKALKQVLSGQQVIVQTGGKTPVPPPVVGKTPSQKSQPQDLEKLAQEIQQVAKSSGMQADVSVTVATVGVRVSFLNGILFDLGRATIRPQSFPLLRHIGAILATVPNNVIIEGYTDDLPIDTSEFHTNWDLSAIRSTRVIEFLIATGLDPARFAAEAYSQYRPIASNNTAQGRQENRRVDLVILRETPYSVEQMMENLDRTSAQ